ncbi:MAG: CSLREA domain-containing protein [Acidobacteriota bacterium]
MFPAKTHVPLAILFVLFGCIAAAAALKFSTPARAGEYSSAKRSISLKEPLAFAEPFTARRAPENSRIVNIGDGHDVETANLPARLAAEGINFSTARPLALVSDDLNNDGLPDLICGYASDKGGFLLVYYGSSRAYAPKEPQDIADQIAQRFPEPFDGVDLIALDYAPDFIVTGDFDRDGKIDILTAPLGGYTLDLAVGSGEGFRSAKAIDLPGQVTAFVSGEKTQPETYGRPIVAINGSNGSQLLEFLGDAGIADQKPVVRDIPDTASFITTGRLDEDRSEDIAIVAGGRLYIQHGDGFDPWPDGVHADAKAGKLEPIDLPFGVSSVSVSDFIWDRDERMELAVTDDSGIVNVLARGELNTTPYSPAEAKGLRKRMIDTRIGRLTADEVVKPNLSDGWTVAETAPSTVGKASSGKTVVRGMLASAQNSYDILSVNSGSRKIEIDFKKADEPTRAVASFSTAATPVAVLPMRLNMHGHSGLVVLQDGKLEPTFMMFAPTATFTVTKGTDTNDGTCNADCSLREALVAANLGAGADMVSIPATTAQLSIADVGGVENISASGDLDVNDDVTLTGLSAASTIIQGSTSAAFAGNMGDKAFGINQDGTHATIIATISNVTVRFTRNDVAVNGAFTETGGATDIFLSGAGAPGGVVAITNCIYDSNANSHSYGGALNVDSAGAGTNVFRGSVQITGSTFSNNKTLATGTSDPPSGGGINLFADKDNVTISSSIISGNQSAALISGNGGGVNIRHSFGGTVTINNGTAINNNTAGSDGGGIMIPGVGGQLFSMTGGTITGNTATGTGDSADGGGILSGNPTNSTTFSGVTISNNIATAGTAGTGGGVKDVSGVLTTIDGCTISGNSADSGGGVATAGGSSQTAVTNSSLTGNTATTGGALLVTAGTLNATLDYINSNTATTGSGVAQTGGTASATNDWWGCDGLPNTAGCQTSSGTVTSSPRIDLVVTAATSPIAPNGTSVITASFAFNSIGGPINPTVMNGRSVSFGATNGSMSPASAAVASLSAASTYTNNGTCGSSTESATLDNGTQNVTVAVNCPATLTKTFNPATVLQNNGTSTLTINFTNPNAVGITGLGLVDNFPLGTQVAATPGGTNSCGGTFAPVAGATTITLSGGSIAASGTCSISVNVTATTAGVKTNTTNGVTSTNAGTGLTATGALTVTNTATWTGSNSIAWATAGNWSPTVTPASTNDVSIPAAGVTNEPTISTAVSVGNITESAGRTLTITSGNSLAASGTCTINGTMSVAGTFTCGSFTGTGTVNFTGATTQNVPSGSYQNIGVTNAAGINLTGSTTVNGTLTMSGGNINTGANVLSIATTGSITRTSGAIIGDIAKSFAGTGPFTYPVGTATGFSPVAVNVTALTINPSTLQVKANDGTAPAVPVLQDTTTLNRFWTLTRTGNLTANVTFNYLNGDVRGNETLYRTIVVRGTTAALIGNSGPCPGAGTVCVDPAANTITILGLTAFSNWTAGELAPSAADVNISGRVFTPGGTGAPGAHVSIVDQQGGTLSAMTNPFGFFQFTGVRAGQSYTVSVKSKYGTYQPRFVTVNEELSDFNFFPVP